MREYKISYLVEERGKSLFAKIVSDDSDHILYDLLSEKKSKNWNWKVHWGPTPPINGKQVYFKDSSDAKRRFKATDPSSLEQGYEISFDVESKVKSSTHLSTMDLSNCTVDILA